VIPKDLDIVPMATKDLNIALESLPHRVLAKLVATLGRDLSTLSIFELSNNILI